VIPDEKTCPLCFGNPKGNALVRVRKDAYPLSEGHVLVTPTRHVQYLRDLTDAEYHTLFKTVHIILSQLGEDANVGVNDGPAAGQTVGHCHVHIIPRRSGDTPDPRGGVRWVLPSKANYWDGEQVPVDREATDESPLLVAEATKSARISYSEQVKSSKAKSKRRTKKGFSPVTVAVVGVAGIAIGTVGALSGQDLTPAQLPAPVTNTVMQQELTVDTTPTSISQIVQNVLPSVVSLSVAGSEGSGTGSGFVLTQDGYIVTNNHVVDLPDAKVQVFFDDGSKAAGTVVGTNPDYDIAVVKVNKSGLKPVSLGDSDQVSVGNVAVAIGAPLGLDGTVTSGIVSALNRPVTSGDSVDDVSFLNAIQTDAAINPGNSGGPLLNSRGEVIGVNSAIATSGSAGSIGLGFAIPINSAKRIANEIVETGESATPKIGVSLDSGYTGDGAKIDEVTKGSGAEKSGLKSGDVITSINGRNVSDATELVVAVRSFAPGDTLVISFKRGNVESSTNAQLD